MDLVLKDFRINSTHFMKCCWSDTDDDVCSRTHSRRRKEASVSVGETGLFVHRSSYPDGEDGGDREATEEELPEKNLEYHDDTMELILPSGGQHWGWAGSHCSISWRCSVACAI